MTLIAFRPKAETYFQIIVLQYQDAIRNNQISLSEVFDIAEKDTQQKFPKFKLK